MIPLVARENPQAKKINHSEESKLKLKYLPKTANRNLIGTKPFSDSGPKTFATPNFRPFANPNDAEMMDDENEMKNKIKLLPIIRS